MDAIMTTQFTCTGENEIQPMVPTPTNIKPRFLPMLPPLHMVQTGNRLLHTQVKAFSASDRKSTRTNTKGCPRIQLDTRMQ
jgi:hypothetical protein